MSTNSELVRLLNEIADLLDLGGERFKPEAYRRAARSLESLAEDVRQVAARGELESIPGVGSAIAEKIREYLRDGRLAYHDRLRAQFPSGVVDLMRLPGVGPKTARRFLVELKVEGPAELAAALDAGRLDGVKGFGPRKIELLRAALASAAPTTGRLPLAAAFVLATRLVAHLRASAPLEQVEVAGSFRRRREDVGDLDLLVTSQEPEKVFDAFSRAPGIREVMLRGGTKETIRLESGLQVDLRVVAPTAFGAALQYFTGSKDHNVHLRTLARDQGLKVNEYGVFREEERIAGTTEEEVYGSLGLSWIPPEIRENRGEIEAAREARLPRLVEEGDLVGDLHVHLGASPDAAAISALAARVAARRLRYLGVVEEAGEGENASERSQARWAELRAAIPASVRLLRGLEAARLDELPEGFDYWVARPAAGRSPPDGAVAPAVVAHFGDAASDRTEGWWAWVATGAALDVGGRGPDAGVARHYLEAGGRLHLAVLEVEGEVALGELAVGTARRSWATREQVLNAGEPPVASARPPRVPRGRRRS